MDQPKIERVLRLMQLMSGLRHYTIEELAERLETSPRSIYRYIDTFKSVGYVVRKEGGVPRLLKMDERDDISQLVHFTEEEAYILKRAIESVDGNTSLKQDLKRKLYKVYDYDILSEIVVRNGIADNVHFLYEAIKQKKQVVFRQYKSSNSHATKDRLVEPFAFTANNNEIWCYELASGKNKLFKVSRITKVEIQQTPWEKETEHQEGFIDVFHNSSDQRLPVTLRLGMAAANLMVEEFPLAEKYMKKEDDSHWMFSAEVCRYEGVARFVLGLYEDVEIVDSPGFEEFMKEKVKKISEKIKV